MKELPAGFRLGEYRITRVAGRGAVGIVYLAEHEGVGQPVAIKTLSPIYAGEPIFRERFSREAQGAAAVEHPNIISVFDTGEVEGLPYLVMTYVDGPDLERVLTERGGKLEPAEAVLICASIADALDAAAAQGLAHRDVKPANILLEAWGLDGGRGRRRRPHVYLTDFGLIKSSAQARVTQTGQFVGTLLYMAPEQIESRAVPASDQYSLACVLWETLTATFPFEPTGGSTLSLLSAHISNPVPRISERPGAWSAALDEVFLRALAKKPEDRYPTCTDFIDDATRALGLGKAAPVVTPTPPKTAIESTQIIPTGPPPGRTAARGPGPANAGPANAGPANAGPAGRTPAGAGGAGTAAGAGAAGPGGGAAQGGAAPGGPHAHPPQGPHGHAGGPGADPWASRASVGAPPPGQPDPTQSLAGTPAAFPSALGFGGPGGISQGHRPPEQASSASRRVLIGVIVLLVLVIAAIAALVLLDGGDDGGGQGEATSATSPGTAVAGGADAPDGDGGAGAGAVEDDGAVQDDDGDDGTIDVAGGPADGDAAPGTEQQTGPSTGTTEVSTGAAGEAAVATGIPPQAQGRLGVVTDGDVWAAAADGAAATNLTAGVLPAPRQPAWQPTAEAVLMASDQGLRLVDVGSGEISAVTEQAGDADPAWAPDGERIAWSTPVSGGRDLAVADLADPSPVLLGIPAALGGDEPVNALRPAWSPDGQAIAFQAAVDGTYMIWVIGADGGAPTAVAGTPDSDDFHPAWTADGDLVFTSDRDGAQSIWLHEVASGAERQVAAVAGTDAHDADLSPCGDWVAFTVEDPAGPRIGYQALEGAATDGGAPDGGVGTMPLPPGVAAMSDPAWAGQPCPA